MIERARYSRRRFLRRSLQLAAAGAAAPWVVPVTALAGPSRCGANERLGIGYIGVGRRGNQLAPCRRKAASWRQLTGIWNARNNSPCSTDAVRVRTIANCSMPQTSTP